MGGKAPGADFAPIGTVATFAEDILKPAILGPPVKAAVVTLAQQIIPGAGKPILITTIAILVPPPS